MVQQAGKRRSVLKREERKEHKTGQGLALAKARRLLGLSLAAQCGK